jgi:hypothetical protein
LDFQRELRWFINNERPEYKVENVYMEHEVVVSKTRRKIALAVSNMGKGRNLGRTQ